MSVNIPMKLKILSGAGVLFAALGAATVSGAFAAPLARFNAANTAAPAAAASPTPGAAGATTTNVNPAPNGLAGRGPRGGPGFRGGFFPGGQSLATFLGINATDLRTALRNGQTLAQVAQAHGKSTDDLKTFLTNQMKQRLDQAVQANRITAAQEQTRLTQFTGNLDKLINTNFQQLQSQRPPGPRGAGFGVANQALATFLGMNLTDLRAALQNGQTLTQIAQAHNQTADSLKTFLTNQLKSRLDQAVQAGRLTAAQEQTRLSQYTANLDKLITTNFQLAGPQGPGRGPGFLPNAQGLATFLGISTTDLGTAFRNGQTLAQIAQAHGKSVADLKTFLTNQEQQRLDAAVKANRITSAQEQTRLNQFTDNLDKLINTNFQQLRGQRGPRPAGAPAATPSG
jgi:transposase-like protein